MIISRERFLDDSGELHLSIAVQSRSPLAHSLLSSAPDTVQQHLGEILTHAANQIVALLQPLAAQRSSPDAAEGHFGCGT